MKHFILQIVIVLFITNIIPTSAFASAGEIDIIESFQLGLKDFQIKTPFDINDYINKKDDEKIYQCKFIKKENEINFYTAQIIGDSFTYHINTNAKTNEIRKFSYDIILFANPKAKEHMNIYNITYNQSLAAITTIYGPPTEESTTTYSGNDYKTATFYEKGKYKYSLGITQNINKDLVLRFTVQTVSSINPESLKLAKKGYDSYINKNFEKAIEYLTQAIEIDPDNTLAHETRIIAYISAKKYNEAIESATATLKTDPENALLYRLRGSAYYAKEINNKAKEDFTLFIKYTEPNDPAIPIIKQIISTM